MRDVRFSGRWIPVIFCCVPFVHVIQVDMAVCARDQHRPTPPQLLPDVHLADGHAVLRQRHLQHRGLLHDGHAVQADVLDTARP